MAQDNPFLTRSRSIKVWRLSIIRFLLFFFAWGSISFALESPVAQLLPTVIEALVFSAVLLLIVRASERHSARTRGIAMVFLGLLSILLLAEVWREGSTHGHVPRSFRSSTGE